jgi:hypothetical protein
MKKHVLGEYKMSAVCESRLNKIAAKAEREYNKKNPKRV